MSSTSLDILNMQTFCVKLWKLVSRPPCRKFRQKHSKAASLSPALTHLTSSGTLRTERLESVDCCLTCIIGEWREPLEGARALLTMPLNHVSGWRSPGGSNVSRLMGTTGRCFRAIIHNCAKQHRLIQGGHLCHCPWRRARGANAL